ncbi:hypothetical protein [Natronoflexus pectinivorans]|uniref:Uncharacterized protein n=1 Tax=Natronoflexus pectinivorans TaxID=682526 RepID=A0A4R2GFN9_9BACT|nr:hypothetical protein [Natronoflexus pectinivorans]TCO07033.1 hypothetical protein EV194_11032 [Natronoflexus pectinivorans]
MITPKIKALFQFIDYLHSNIENFKQYDEVINELHLLDKERQKVSSKKTFKDKLKYDEVQEQIKNKFKVIQGYILTPIQAKSNELNICDFNDTNQYYKGEWRNNFLPEIEKLKRDFHNSDLPEIFNHKNKYLEYRTATKGEAFFGLVFFFSDLDEVLKILFDFFKESEQNEFEAFETKTIEISSYTELAEIISGKNALNIEIDTNLSITEKLDYWKRIIDKHFNEPLTKQFGEYEFTIEQEQAKEKQLVKLFGTNYRLISPLFIPEYIYNEHFLEGLNNPEFTYWFLKNNARTYFDVEIRMKRFPEKLKTPLSENFIKAELKKLNDFEQKAESLLHESMFDIYKDYSYSEYAKEIEYLRIKADYYKDHALTTVQAMGNTTVILFAEHIYLKGYLEKELRKKSPKTICPKIKPLDIEVIELNGIALSYYNKYFKFIKVTDKDSGVVVYVPESVSNYIEEARLKYPWTNYGEGFFNQYKIGIVCHPDAMRFQIEKNIRHNYHAPTISYKYGSNKKQTPYFNESKAFEYGEYMALIYCAWELIIRDFPIYEKIFTIDESTYNNEALPPQPINITESKTKQFIFQTFASIDKKGWQYAFVSEHDYNLFTELLTNFFEYTPYTLPETTIQLKRTCKTKVAKALGEIHKELSNENKLSTDDKYFKLIKVLSHFEKEAKQDLYKALTR